jgi:hypothetical protein
MTVKNRLAKISVVVPSYNKPEYLPECLRSVQAQTFTDWECIVVNDGSPRGDEIRVAVAAMNDPRFRLVEHEINRGLAAARNTGVREARAELVICVDEDDWIREDCLGKLLHAMQAGDSEIVCPHALWIGEGEARIWKCRVVAIPEILVTQPLLPAGFIMRKSAWDRVGGWDEHPVLRNGREDTEWWIRAVKHGCTIAICDEPLYCYRQPFLAEELTRSLNITARRHELRLRKYIINKHRDIYQSHLVEKRRFLCGALRAEAWYHQRYGSRWRFVLRLWQVPFHSRKLRDVRNAIKGMLAALLGERRLESILRWKRRMAGAQDAQMAG